MSSSASALLLKNGTVLQHQADDSVAVLFETDILIQGNRISRIAANAQAPTDAEIIDCTGKIISPGLIDTHNHLWLTQAKARHAEQTLFEYMYTGNMQSFNFDPADMYWGQLGGCAEAIDGGTTTVVDHAHLTYSADHVFEAIEATVQSGIRAIFCYVPIERIKQWEPLTPDTDFLPSWMMEQLESLAKAQPFGPGGRVSLGFGFDLWALPKDTVVGLWDKVRQWGVELLTTHYCKNRIFGLSSIPQLLHDYGILGPDVIVSHATQCSEEDRKLISQAKAWISATPESEGQMALGLPMTFHEDVSVAIGVDCHFIGPSDLMSQMRLALQLARQDYNQKILNDDKFPLTTVGNSAKAFNIGTIEGARAVRMQNDIGSLAEGKLADVVIFSATSPTMICAAQADPVTAIVRHASIRDVETVIVDGVVRKRDGKLLSFPAVAGMLSRPQKPEVSWEEAARALITSRDKTSARIDSLDMSAGRAGALKSFDIDEGRLVP